MSLQMIKPINKLYFIIITSSISKIIVDLVSESPETNRWISEEELDFILKNRDQGAATTENQCEKFFLGSMIA